MAHLVRDSDMKSYWKSSGHIKETSFLAFKIFAQRTSATRVRKSNGYIGIVFETKVAMSFIFILRVCRRRLNACKHWCGSYLNFNLNMWLIFLKTHINMYNYNWMFHLVMWIYCKCPAQMIIHPYLCSCHCILYSKHPIIQIINDHW